MKIGASAARDLFLTGRRFSAAKAKEIGLAHDVVPAAELDATVDRYVTEALSAAPTAVARAKNLIPHVLGKAPADVMVAVFDAADTPHALRVADLLRQSGLRVLVYPESDKIGKQIKYADSLGVPFVAILGGNEMAAGTLTVKNLAAQTQATYDQAVAGGAILEGMPEIAEQIFDLPIRRGLPEGVGGLADHVSSPTFGTPVGLVLYAHRNRPTEHAGGSSAFARVAGRLRGIFREFF